MTATSKQLLDQVLALNEQERSEFMDHLSESFGAEKDPGYDAAWESELRERIAQVERSEVKLIPWRQAMEQIRNGVIDAE